jgi:dihydrofolate reductase
MKIILLMALTVDGKIGRNANHFPDWTGSADKRLFKQTTQDAGVVIMGRKTFDTIGKPLPGRKNVIITRNPSLIATANNLIYTTLEAPVVVQNLAAQGFERAVLAGGASVNSLFARHGLIDEMLITFAPRIFGQGVSLFTDAVDMRLDLLDLQKLGDDMVLAHYAVRHVCQ